MRNPRWQPFSSLSSVLVWTGENETKTLVWTTIFSFVFALMKTDSFENTLVWLGLDTFACFQYITEQLKKSQDLLSLLWEECVICFHGSLCRIKSGLFLIWNAASQFFRFLSTRKWIKGRVKTRADMHDFNTMYIAQWHGKYLLAHFVER